MSDKELSPQEREALLKLARQTIEELVAAGKSDQPPAGLPGPEMERGAFVTIHRHGQLRGCIGNFTADGSLVNTICDMAEAAASQDPRFPPVSAAELDDIDLEISVLSPLREVEDVAEIEVGKHGIYIINPRGRGVLLPQVATEYGWDRETFLDHTCLKAGLSPDCWKDPASQVLVFSAQIFGEKKEGG